MPTPKQIISDYQMTFEERDIGNYNAEEIIASLDAAGYVIVPKEPNMTKARQIAEEAVLLLRRKNMSAKDIEAAVQKIEAMIDAILIATPWAMDAQG